MSKCVKGEEIGGGLTPNSRCASAAADKKESAPPEVAPDAFLARSSAVRPEFEG